MKCPRCQHENEAGAKFCEECAAPLARTCSNCGRQLSANAKFCPECAHPASTSAPAPAAQRFISPEAYPPKHLADKILTSKSTLEGERKQVTVLFADLKGSMELLADRDPEEARKILDPVLERMMEAVHRYEGTVNQVMGDGIMALFGAPLAHEDHAVRACYAALRMQASVKGYAEELRRSEGIPVQIRVGLNSGEVVVRSIGNDLRMDYTAVGQTTHLAARLEQMALPGSILISAGSLRLAEGYAEVKPLGSMSVKGLIEPVEVYEVTGAGAVRTRLQATVSRGLSRFVGRDEEIEQLRRALQKAGEGHGQVVAVIGEPGVGKSRLYYEFIRSHRTQGWRVLESGSVSYGRASAYLPVVGLLKAYFKIHDRDDHREIREKVTGKLLTLEEALKPLLPAVLALLDVPVEDGQWRVLDAPQRRLRTLDAVKRLLVRESQVQPVLVVFEDLHWIDSETQTVLDTLVESAPSMRVLLLVNYRPEYQHGWGTKTYYTQLRIDPLPAASAEEFLLALLGDDESLRPLRPLLVARTEGNPFFLEESIRTLVETRALVGERGAYRMVKDLTTIQVAPSVQAILAARIDRLSREEKRLLQAASVIGKDVPFSLLQAIGGLPEDALRGGLTYLQAAEFLSAMKLFPDLEYSFKHALTQEVAYGSILLERRRTLHTAIVETLERLPGDRLSEHLEMLAHHTLRGELWEKAARYLRRAGAKAGERSALQDARAWLEQALGALKALPESRSTLEQAVDIRLELGYVLNLLDEVQPSLECVREAEALAERSEDDRRRGRVWVSLASRQSQLGELDEALAFGTRALATARELGDLELRRLTTTILAQTHYYRSDYERVVELATDNLTASPADSVDKSSPSWTARSFVDRLWLLVSLTQLGRFTEAAEQEAEAIRLAELTPIPLRIGQAHVAAGSLHLFKGDWEKARLLIEHGITALRTGNVVYALPLAVAFSASAQAKLGEASEALSRLQEGEQLLKRHGARGGVHNRGWSYHSLGRASLLLGQVGEAQRLGDRAVEYSPREPGCAAHALHLLGDIATHPDRFDAASGESHYRKALALAEPRGMRPLVAHCHLGLGKLYRRIGKREQAQEHLTTATTMYREMGMTYWLEKAEAE